MKTVRIATINDAATISFFQTVFAKEYNEDSTNIVKGVLNTLENKTPQKSLYLISADVDENGEAATGCLRISYRFSDWRNKAYIYIDGVFVLKEFRKQGFLKLLLNKCKEIAIENDCDRLTLFVEDTNTVAQTAYKNYGFKQGREWEYVVTDIDIENYKFAKNATNDVHIPINHEQSVTFDLINRIPKKERKEIKNV